MSGFFPWNFKAGSGDSGDVPETGCPLENHPLWSIVAGTGPSNLCWDSMDGRSILVNADTADILNISYRGLSFINGTVSAVISMVSPADDNWMLPLCGRMIDSNNLIGARWNDGEFQVIERRNGTWDTLFTGGPEPAIGDKVTLILSSKFWKLVVNGTLIGEGETLVPDSAGYWGMSQHRSPGFVGHRLFSNFTITDNSFARTPCMTSNTSPYGEASTSSSFDGGYPAWRGMNCSASVGSDCWVSAMATPMPQWLQWIGPADQPSMVPDRIIVKARKILASHNTTYGPKKLTLLGSNDDGQSWDAIQTWDDLDFGVTPTFESAVTGAQSYLAIRLQVDEVRQTDPTSELTQIGTFTVYGHTKDLEPVENGGEAVTYNTEPVYYRS